MPDSTQFERLEEAPVGATAALAVAPAYEYPSPSTAHPALKV